MTFSYLLHLADTSLILSQRNSEWTGHGPALEQDIAITNIALDSLGQARNFYQHAAVLYNEAGKEVQSSADCYLPKLWKPFERQLEEDDLAFLRDEHQYLNLMMVELPKGDWAFTVLRQFFVSAFQYYQFTQLQNSTDSQIAAIAEKSIKEITYHLRWSSEWVVRLGDSTEEAKARLDKALGGLWMYTGEMFQPADYENVAVLAGIGADPASLRQSWLLKVQEVFAMANLDLPEQAWMQTGGKEGRHTEYLGYLLAEMQHLQRAYPNSKW